MERLTLLMWRKPSLEKKHNATDVASEMLNIIEITRECIPEFSTFYIPASKKNGVKEAVLSKECIESLLHMIVLHCQVSRNHTTRKKHGKSE